MSLIFIHSAVVSSCAGSLSSVLRKESIQSVAERCYYEIIRYDNSAVLPSDKKSEEKSLFIRESELQPLFLRELEGAAVTLYEYYMSHSSQRYDDDEYYDEYLIPDQMDTISEILADFHILKEKKSDLTDYQLTACMMDMNESVAIITAMMRESNGSGYFRNALASVNSAWEFLSTLSKELQGDITVRRLDNYLETTAKDIFLYAQKNPLDAEEVNLLRNFGKSFPMKVLDLTDNSWMYCA